MTWAVLMRSENRLDGKHERMRGTFGLKEGTMPLYVGISGVPALFNTRAEARTFVDAEFGYIRDRKDLQQEPHGWKIPLAVKVKVTVEIMEPSTPSNPEEAKRSGT